MCPALRKHCQWHPRAVNPAAHLPINNARPLSYTTPAAGVTYQQRNDLPQGTILLDGQDIMVRDSTFSEMVFFGQASVILLNSNVDFDNVRLEQRLNLLSCSLHSS